MMTHNIEKVCLLDMDGTVADLMGAYVEANDLMRFPGEPEWNPSEDPWPEYIKNRLDSAKRNPGFWQGLKKLKSGFEIMHAAIKIGYDINVLTKGPFSTTNAWTEKVNWCRDNLPKGTKVTITEDKGLSYGRVLIDDYGPYIERWLKWRPRGLVIQPLNGYNKPIIHPNVVLYSGYNLYYIQKALSAAYMRDYNMPLIISTHIAPSGQYRVVIEDLSLVGDYSTCKEAMEYACQYTNTYNNSTFVHDDKGNWIETYFGSEEERKKAKTVYGHVKCLMTLEPYYK